MSSEELLTPARVTEGQQDKIICRLCRRQFAKYTCPMCNAPYCSLVCFRSGAHDQCSEAFYKKEVESYIHSGPSKTVQERQEMLDLLKKFEEQSIDDEIDFEDGGGGEEDSSFAQRFTGIDLGSVSADDIWSKLTMEERNEFMKALKNPTGKLAQELLANEQVQKEIQGPWWEAPALSDIGQFSDDSLSRCFGSKPEILEIPPSLLKPIPTGHSLLYNICAVCIAYAYITRHLGTSPLSNLTVDDPEYYEAHGLFTRLIPFLTDRKSTTSFPNLSVLITDLWSSFDPGQMTNGLCSLLLQDASRLLSPVRIAEVHSDDLPDEMVLLVLSDLHAFFSKGRNPGHIAQKLLFYAAYILSTPKAFLETLAKVSMAKAEHFRTFDKI